MKESKKPIFAFYRMKEESEKDRKRREEWLKNHRLSDPTMPHADFLRTLVWKNKRQEIIDNRIARCEVCDSDEKINVHHNNYSMRGQERDSHLIVLCRECHHLFHSKREGEVALSPRPHNNLYFKLWDLKNRSHYLRVCGYGWSMLADPCALCARKPAIFVKKQRPVSHWGIDWNKSEKRRPEFRFDSGVYTFCEPCYKIFKDRFALVEKVMDLADVAPSEPEPIPSYPEPEDSKNDDNDQSSSWVRPSIIRRSAGQKDRKPPPRFPMLSPKKRPLLKEEQQKKLMYDVSDYWKSKKKKHQKKNKKKRKK